MYRLVVAMSACPAFVMTAIGLDPAAASFVIAVCRRSWKALGCFSTPAALSAAVRASLNVSGRYVVPRSGGRRRARRRPGRPTGPGARSTPRPASAAARSTGRRLRSSTCGRAARSRPGRRPANGRRIRCNRVIGMTQDTRPAGRSQGRVSTSQPDRHRNKNRNRNPTGKPPASALKKIWGVPPEPQPEAKPEPDSHSASARRARGAAGQPAGTWLAHVE
jgi:hypothetical protein